MPIDVKTVFGNIFHKVYYKIIEIPYGPLVASKIPSLSPRASGFALSPWAAGWYFRCHPRAHMVFIYFSVKSNHILNYTCKIFSIYVCTSQYGNYGNLLSLFFGKNFVKVTFLLKKLLKSWFDEIFLVTVNFCYFHSVYIQFLTSSPAQVISALQLYNIPIFSSNQRNFALSSKIAIFSSIWRKSCFQMFYVFL